METQLESLKTGKPVRWVHPEGRANALAGKIRAALAVAARHPKLYPELAKAATQYKIIVLDQYTVFANPITEVPPA